MEEVDLPLTCEDSATYTHQCPTVLSWLSELPVDWLTESTNADIPSAIDEVIPRDGEEVSPIAEATLSRICRKRKRSLLDDGRRQLFEMPDQDSDTTSMMSAPTVISSGTRTSTNTAFSNRPKLIPKGPSTRTSRSGSTSPTRSKSPTRVVLAALLESSPPVVICRADKINNPEPEEVTRLRRSLMEGIRRPIPRALEDQLLIHLRETTYEEYDMVENVRDDKNDESVNMALLWNGIITVHKEAAACNDKKKDENAWINVIRSMLQVEGLHASSAKLEVNSVQTQMISAEYLPTSAQTQIPISKMADLALAFPSTGNPSLEKWHKKNPGKALSHLKDAYTASVPMVCPIEVKNTSGNKDEAYCQLGIWSAAALAKINSVKEMSYPESSDSATTEQTLANLSQSMPYLGFVVVLHAWELNIVWKGVNGAVTVFQPLTGTLVGDTSSYLGIFKLWRLIQGVKRWLLGTWWHWYQRDVLGSIDGDE